LQVKQTFIHKLAWSAWFLAGLHTDQLDSLLNPVGQHRKHHVPPSKGRWARRKKLQAKADGASLATATNPSPPPVPEISKYLDVGLPAVTRHLHDMAQRQHVQHASENCIPDKHDSYAAVFIAHPRQLSPLDCHIPQMVGVAANAQPKEEPAMRLVGFSVSCAERLSACLGIPRASCIGLKADAPGAGALLEAVRKGVPAVDSAWLHDANRAAVFNPTKINSVETKVGAKRMKKSVRSKRVGKII